MTTLLSSSLARDHIPLTPMHRIGLDYSGSRKFKLATYFKSTTRRYPRAMSLRFRADEKELVLVL